MFFFYLLKHHLLPLTSYSLAWVLSLFLYLFDDVHHSKHQLIKKLHFYANNWVKSVRKTLKIKKGTNRFFLCWLNQMKQEAPASAMTSRCADSHLVQHLLLFSHLHCSQSCLFLCVKVNKGTRSDDVISGDDVTAVRTLVRTSSNRWGQPLTNQLFSPVPDGIHKGYVLSLKQTEAMSHCKFTGIIYLINFM